MATKRVPTRGWHVEIDHPDGQTLTPTVLEGSTPKGSLNDTPRVEVRVPASDRWENEELLRAPMRVWVDGERKPIERFERVTRTAEATVLHGRGGIELDKDIEFDVGELVDVHDRAEQLVDEETDYVANVDSPDSNLRTSIPQLTVDSVEDWHESLLVDPPADLPYEVTDQGVLQALRTTYYVKVWDSDTDDSVNTIRGTTFFDTESDPPIWTRRDSFTPRYIQFDDTTMNNVESGVIAFDELEYEIPADNLRVAFRRECPTDDPDFGSHHHGFSVRINGELMEDVPPDALGHNPGDPRWFSVAAALVDSDSFGPGEVEFEVRFNEELGTTNAEDPEDAVMNICSIALYDNRFPPGYERHLDDGYVIGDHYPAGVEVETADRSNIEQIVGAELNTTPNDTSGDFEVALSPDSGISYPLTSSESSVAGAFEETTTSIRARFTIGGFYSGARHHPIGRDTAHEIDSFELFVDLDDTPFVSGSGYDGSILEVLQGFANNHGFVFSLEWDEEADTLSIEWTRPGQRPTSTSAAVLDFETEVDAETVVERTIVYGRSRRVRDEEITLSTDEYIDIGDDYIQPGTERVVDEETGVVYQINDDYEILFNEGVIRALSSGSIDDGQTVLMDFETRIAAEYALPTADGSGDTIRRTVEAASTRQLAEQAAISITRQLAEAQRGATVTLDRETGFELVGALNVEGVSIDAQVVRDLESDERSVDVRLGERFSAGDVIDDVERRVESVARRL